MIVLVQPKCGSKEVKGDRVLMSRDIHKHYLAVVINKRLLIFARGHSRGVERVLGCLLPEDRHRSGPRKTSTDVRDRTQQPIRRMRREHHFIISWSDLYNTPPF
jgi:hypothetical protein